MIHCRRTGAATLLVLTLVGLAGCSHPQPNSLHEPAGLQQIPVNHRVQLVANLGEHSWAVFLWNHTDDAKEPQLGITVEARISFPSNFQGTSWFGFNEIFIGHNRTGARTFANVFQPFHGGVATYYNALLTSPNGLFGGERTVIVDRARAARGYLVFSEHAARITINETLGQGGPTMRLLPYAAGTDLTLSSPPSSLEEFAPIPNRSIVWSNETKAGFVAVALGAELPPPYDDFGTARVHVAFPGNHRNHDRTRTYVSHIVGTPQSQCAYEQGLPTAPPSICQVALGGIGDLAPLAMACQPTGRTRADIISTTQTVERYFPVIINVPFDYCTPLGISETSPESCEDTGHCDV